MSEPPRLYLGDYRSLCGSNTGRLYMPAHHLVTHGVCVGMTGSGKTGAVMVMVEEALRAEVPVLIIDVKGDLPNLLLRFPTLTAEALLPWVDNHAPTDKRTPHQRASALVESHTKGLAAWDLTELAVADYVRRTDVRVITPGSSAGELLHVLSSLERRSTRWDHDPESARAALSAAVSLLLRLLGRDPDPAKSREHVLLSVLAARRLAAKQGADRLRCWRTWRSRPSSRSAPCPWTSFCRAPSASSSPPRSTPCWRRPPSPAGAKARPWT